MLGEDPRVRRGLHQDSVGGLALHSPLVEGHFPEMGEKKRRLCGDTDISVHWGGRAHGELERLSNTLRLFVPEEKRGGAGQMICKSLHATLSHDSLMSVMENRTHTF